MNFLDYFKITFSDFNKRKFRSIINIFAISVGVMFIITMVSLGSGLQNYMIGQISELNNLKHISMSNIAYQSAEELQSKLSTPNEDGDIDIDNVFEKKAITKDIIDKISKMNEVDELITNYNEEISEVNFNSKKSKDVKLTYYNGATYLKSEEENLIKNNKENGDNTPLRYILVGRELKPTDTLSVVVPEDIIKTTFDVKDAKTAIGKEISFKDIIPNYNEDKVFEKKATVVGVINSQFYQSSILVSKDIMEELKNFKSQSDKINSIKNEEELKSKESDIDTSTVNTDIAQEESSPSLEEITKAILAVVPEDKKIEERGFDTVEISAKDVEDVSTIVNYIEQELGYSTENVQMVAETLNKILLGIKLALSVIGVIVIAIASLDVINTMIMSIYERTKKIGIMKATGATKKDIRNLFLVEGAIIGLFGGLLGTVFARFSLIIIKQVLSIILQSLEFTDLSFLDFIVRIDIHIVFMTIIFSIFITTIASFYPAVKASRLDPIEALRHD